MKKGGILITLGLLLLAAALGLAAFNLCEDSRAAMNASAAAQQLRQELPAPPVNREETEAEAVPDYVLAPEMEMPTVTVNGQDYIGTLQLPQLELEFPVISRWSYPRLKLAPCRYTGSAYTGDLVIAAHNYSCHFGRLKDLAQGDLVRFTDADGNVFTYAVAVREVLPPTAVEEMTAGEWDLTLFTCTLGGRSRVTVRCELVETE